MSRSRFVALALLALLASSCGSSREASRVGMERDQTNITYGFTASAAARAKALGKQAAIGVDSGPVQTPLPTFSPIFASGKPVSGPCPTANPTAPVDSRAPTDVQGRPGAGTYIWRASGSYTLSGTKVPIANIFVQYILPPKTFTDTFPAPAGAPHGDAFTYQTFETSPGGQYWKFSWQVKTQPHSAQDPEGGLVLKQIDASDSQGKSTATYFRSSSTGLLMAPLPVKAGQSWQAVSFDAANGRAIQLSAQVLKREVLDVCGTLIEGWHVHGSLLLGGSSGTLDYLIATEYGGRIVSLAADGSYFGGYTFEKAYFHDGQIDPRPLPQGVQ